MARDTIIPRPGVKCVQKIDLTLAESVKLDSRARGVIESALNDEFLEPAPGELAVVFRSRVSQSAFFTDQLIVTTTTSEINRDHIRRMEEIIFRETGVNVKDWSISASLERKSLGVDEA